jgi:hypothetical protein
MELFSPLDFKIAGPAKRGEVDSPIPATASELFSRNFLLVRITGLFFMVKV